ncbi:hypothetical protein GGI43DRAFT_394515 [Trichoderma evansii]
MDFTPDSEKSSSVPAKNDEVVKTFSTLKAWLSNDPSFPKTPVAPKSPSFLKNQVVQESAAVTTISETSHQEQHEANYCFKRPPSILDTINRILSPAKPTEQEPVKRRATPIHSLKLTEGLTEFEGKSQQSEVSWNISEGLSDDGYQNEQVQYTASEETNVSRTMGWLLQISNQRAAVDWLTSTTTMDHYKKDIDPQTGEFLPEIIYPDTFKSLGDGPSRDHRDIAWRQANLTVELQINREIRCREALATKVRSQLEPEVEAIEPAAWPDAECIVRPAKPEDFEAIATIMNLESKAKINPQVFEWKELVAADIQEIYKSCQDNLRPFVVATAAEDPLLDRSKWPENASKAYQSYLAFCSTQPEVPQTIFGFAFVIEARIGILGTACPGSRHAGQIKVVVHPDHRGKFYGSALLDRVLLCTAPFHRSMVDYEWQCQNPMGIYENISYQNRRIYAWIYIETFCADRANPAMRLVTKFLRKFEFKEVGRLPSAIKTDRYYESQWLDLVLWARETQPRSNIVESTPGFQTGI